MVMTKNDNHHDDGSTDTATMTRQQWHDNDEENDDVSLFWFYNMDKKALGLLHITIKLLTFGLEEKEQLNRVGLELTTCGFMCFIPTLLSSPTLAAVSLFDQNQPFRPFHIKIPIEIPICTGRSCALSLFVSNWEQNQLVRNYFSELFNLYENNKMSIQIPWTLCLKPQWNSLEYTIIFY